MLGSGLLRALPSQRWRNSAIPFFCDWSCCICVPGVLPLLQIGHDGGKNSLFFNLPCLSWPATRKCLAKQAKLQRNFRPLMSSRVEEGRGAACAVRFPSPLIKPDVRISRIRLSDWFHPGHTVGGQYERSSYPHSTLAPRYSLLGKRLVSCGASWARAKSPTLAFFNKRTRSQGPSLRQRYPASIVLRPRQYYDSTTTPSDPHL